MIARDGWSVSNDAPREGATHPARGTSTQQPKEKPHGYAIVLAPETKGAHFPGPLVPHPLAQAKDARYQVSLPAKKLDTEPGLKVLPGKTGLGALLSKAKKATTKKASGKPSVTLGAEEQAQLEELLTLKAEADELKGRIGELEADLAPVLEEKRQEVCRLQQGYVSTVRAKTSRVPARWAAYTVTHRYSALAPEALEELELPEEVAAKLDVKHEVKLAPGALEVPEVVEALTGLAEWLVVSSKVTPSKTFSERASYDPEEAAIMAALQDAGMRRYKPTIKLAK